MATVTPLTPSSIAVDTLRDMVSQSATFQALFGAAGTAAQKAALAKSKVYPFDVAEPTDTYFAVAGVAAFTRTKSGTAFQDSFFDDGILGLSFYFNTPAQYEDDRPSAYYWFVNTVETILNETCELSGQGGYLSFNRIEAVVPFLHSDNIEGETENYWIVKYQITYGP